MVDSNATGMDGIMDRVLEAPAPGTSGEEIDVRGLTDALVRGIGDNGGSASNVITFEDGGVDIRFETTGRVYMLEYDGMVGACMLFDRATGSSITRAFDPSVLVSELGASTIPAEVSSKA